MHHASFCPARPIDVSRLCHVLASQPLSPSHMYSLVCCCSWPGQPAFQHVGALVEALLHWSMESLRPDYRCLFPPRPHACSRHPNRGTSPYHSAFSSSPHGIFLIKIGVIITSIHPSRIQTVSRCFLANPIPPSQWHPTWASALLKSRSSQHRSHNRSMPIRHTCQWDGSHCLIQNAFIQRSQLLRWVWQWWHIWSTVPVALVVLWHTRTGQVGGLLAEYMWLPGVSGSLCILALAQAGRDKCDGVKGGRWPAPFASSESLAHFRCIDQSHPFESHLNGMQDWICREGVEIWRVCWPLSNIRLFHFKFLWQ